MTKDNPYHDNSMWKGAPSEIFRRAEKLRNDPTKAEQKLWEELQLNPFKKFHFRRQHPINHFIADFYSHKMKLIIEVDGAYHQSEDQQRKDKIRTDQLNFQEIEIIRFTNQEVMEDIETVLKAINEKIYF
jgi:very-short-patch-repair endonuclease